MATPKFNRVALQFMQRINDPTTEAGSPLVIVAGKQLTSVAKIETFVNRAMMELFNQLWTAVQGDRKLFSQLLPELIKQDSFTTDASGLYTISSTKLRSMYVPLDLRIGSTPIDLVPPEAVEYIETSDNALAPSTTNFYCLHKGTILKFYPAASFNAQVVNIGFIQLPVSDTDGSLLVSGGSVDIPFSDQWENQIASIAADLYFKTVGEA